MLMIHEPPMELAPSEALKNAARGARIGRLRELQPGRLAMLSGSELVASSLAALEFTWIAGVGGTPVHGIYKACSTRGMRVLGTRTQAGATLMTAAAAFVAGQQTGAVVLSAGPAVTNAITGILVARDNGWPLLVLGGRRAVPGEEGDFQQFDAATFIQPIAKWTACAYTAEDIPHLIREAVSVARCGRPGPVYIDLPENVLDSRIADPGPLHPLVVEPAAPEARLIDRLARRLRDARYPVLILGDRLRWRLDHAQVLPWLDGLALPVVSLPLMRGVLAESHPSAVQGTESRSKVLAKADLIALFGVDLDWRLRFGAEIDRGASLVMIDHSPAPPLKVAKRVECVVADPGLFLNGLAQRSELHNPPGASPVPAVNHAGVLNSAASQGVESPQTHAGRLTIREVFTVIRAVMPPNTFLVVDGKITLEAAQRFLTLEHPFLYLDPGWNGCMGTGIPFAMAARLHHPGRPLLLVTGDLAFGMGAIELETAIRHQLPFVVLVVNNDGGVGSQNQTRYLPPDYAERVYAFQTAVAYDEVARGLGFPACRACTSGDLQQALSSGLGSSQPLLINTLVNPASSAKD